MKIFLADLLTFIAIVGLFWASLAVMFLILWGIPATILVLIEKLIRKIAPPKDLEMLDN